MENTKISWTKNTFNLWYGCTEVSEGCRDCYARTLMEMIYGKVAWGKGQKRIKTRPEEIKKVFRWNKEAEKSGHRAQVFSASLSDVFDTEVPDDWRDEFFDLIRKTPHLDWLLLTKRPNKAVDYVKGKDWPVNAWFGVTIENNNVLNRLEHLRAIPAPVRFVSMEPLLENVKINLEGVDWVIVGGESGFTHRTMRKSRVLDIKKQCEEAKVPFFFKQWGGNYSTENGHELEGKVYHNFPTPKPERVEALKVAAVIPKLTVEVEGDGARIKD